MGRFGQWSLPASGLESRSEPRHKSCGADGSCIRNSKRVQEPFFVGSHPPQGVSAMRRRRRWLYRSEPERTEEALRQTIAELCQALSADRLQQVLRAARYAAEGRNFVLIDLDLWRKPEWRPVLQRLLEEGEPPCPER
jgi:hypothetical protein